MSRSTTIALYLCVCCAAFALDPAKPLASYQRQNWQTENGLPQNTIHSIVQTRNGYLWFATEGGLVRFDGLKFTVFDSQNTPALRSNNIRALFEDSSHSLWIATADGLTVFRDNGNEVFTNAEGLPANSVWSLSQTPGGQLLALTSAGSALYAKGRFEIRDSKESPEPESLASLKDSHGAVWTASRHGITRTINSRIETFAPNDSLSTDAILSLFEDREGDIWIGGEASGITVLRDQKLTTFSAKDGLAGDFTRCVYQDRKGALWVGGNNGLTRLAEGKTAQFTVQNGLSSNLVFALAETGAGDLLAGTQDGLNIVHDGRVRQVLTTADGLPDDSIRSLLADPQNGGGVWIGTRRGLTLWKNNTFHTYTATDGLASDLVGALLRDREGALWVGTLRGLTRFEQGRFQTFTAGNGLASNIVTALAEDSAGILWIGTQDGGLHRLQNGHIVHSPANVGLPASIYAIVEEGAFLFLTSKTGVYRVAKSDLQPASSSINVSWYGTADGMRVNECSEGGHPAAGRAQNGSLWFATSRGVSVLESQTAVSVSPAPPTVVESFVANDQPVPLAAAPEIQPNAERFAFEYSGISFVAPQRVRFRYQLEGFDRSWVDAGTRRTAYYTSLGPGDYRFRVKARANDGVWSDNEAVVSFRLLPHFYQTYWFYLLLAAALALCVFAAYRWRVQQVERRFQLVLAERNRIAREIHDTLAQGFVAVSLQLELLARKLKDAPEDVRSLVQQTRALVQSGIEEARRSIWQLRSEGADSADFRSRLSQIVNETGNRAGLQVEFRVIGTYRALPETVESELLKIAQEAIANAARHAQATQLKVNVAYEGKTFHMTISDNGRGFTGDAPAGHYGLRGMKERAAQIGAQIQVQSQPGEGTRVEVEKIVV